MTTKLVLKGFLEGIFQTSRKDNHIPSSTGKINNLRTVGQQTRTKKVPNGIKPTK